MLGLFERAGDGFEPGGGDEVGEWAGRSVGWGWGVDVWVGMVVGVSGEGACEVWEGAEEG